MPWTLNNLIIQTLDMAKKMSDEICQITLEMILEKLNEFHISYMKQIDLYKKSTSLIVKPFATVSPNKWLPMQMIANPYQPL